MSSLFLLNHIIQQLLTIDNILGYPKDRKYARLDEEYQIFRKGEKR